MACLEEMQSKPDRGVVDSPPPSIYNMEPHLEEDDRVQQQPAWEEAFKKKEVGSGSVLEQLLAKN